MASFWKLRLRFYWSTVYANFRRAYEQCAHCDLINTTEQIVEWKTPPCDIPFYVIFTNVRSHGAISSRNGDCKGLNSMEGISGFVIGDMLTVVDSITVAQSMYKQVFTKFGLPRLLVVNTGSEFRATLKAVATLMFFKIIMLPPKSHHAQRCGRFHRFINNSVLIMTQYRGESGMTHSLCI
jgi:hypothetical protein